MQQLAVVKKAETLVLALGPKLGSRRRKKIFILSDQINFLGIKQIIYVV
jgi:hypothetical protein